jgi:hypothetical protein
VLVEAAATYVILGHSDAARAVAAAGVGMGRDEGFTSAVILGAIAAASLAAHGDDLEAAAVLLAGVARHGDPLGIGGSQVFHTCRVEAQAAVDGFPGNLDAARSLGAAMTFDDLINYTLDHL